jgi:thioester reductase-like protein
MEKRNILLTGVTGLVGWNLANYILENTQDKLILFLRAKNNLSAQERFARVLDFAFPINKSREYQNRLEIIEADLTSSNLGLSEKAFADLASRAEIIFHSAATCDLSLPFEELRQANVEGTRSMLELAQAAKAQGVLIRFNQISTAAVAGNWEGKFFENDLDLGQGFNNGYERSKFEGEKVCQEYRQKGLPLTIYRPSLVIGSSQNGEIINFHNLFYQQLHILSQELYDTIPADSQARYNLVPVDYLVKAIWLISQDEKALGKTFHLVNDYEITLEEVLALACNYFGYKKPKLVPLAEFDLFELQGFRRRLLQLYFPYLNRAGGIFYDATCFHQILNGCFSWPVINQLMLERMFHFCAEVGYVEQRKA